MKTVWCATGNNVSVVGDTSRRICHIRLDSNMERPEERDDFKYADIEKHVKKNRKELLSAALTILKSYFIAKPKMQKLKPWGSFEDWSKLIRQCIVWLGLPDPGDTREEIVAVGDSNTDAFLDFLMGWKEIDLEGKGLTVSDLIRKLREHERSFHQLRRGVLSLCDCKNDSLPTAHALANKLRSFRDRILSGKVLSYRKEGGNKRVWLVSDCDTGDTE